MSDKVYKTIIGEAFKIKRPESGEDDKTYFTVKSFVTGKYISCTLWDNSHSAWLEAHPEFVNGVAVIVNGSVKSKTVDDKTYINLSVGRIGTIPMDEGIDTREGSDSEDNPAAKEDVI